MYINFGVVVSLTVTGSLPVDMKFKVTCCVYYQYSIINNKIITIKFKNNIVGEEKIMRTFYIKNRINIKCVATNIKIEYKQRRV